MSPRGVTSNASDNTSPLELPEITELIFKHLSKKDLIQCLRVCRAWYSMVLPAVWRSVRLVSGRRRGPFHTTMERYSHLLQSLVFESKFEDGSFDMISYPNLQSVELITVIYHEKHLTKFFRRNPSIIRLRLVLTQVSWSVIENLRELKVLEIVTAGFGMPTDSSLWGVCKRLESLTLRSCDLSEPPKDLVCPDLVSFEITQYTNTWDSSSIVFASKCPRLNRLSVHGFIPGNVQAEALVREFTHHVMTGSWPELRCLKLCLTGISDKEIAGVLDSMSYCVEWQVDSSDFGPLSFNSLRRHFSTLQNVSLIGCKLVTAEMVQEILTSCPLLKTFQRDESHTNLVQETDGH
jgi:hypothetical protein